MKRYTCLSDYIPIPSKPRRKQVWVSEGFGKPWNKAAAHMGNPDLLHILGSQCDGHIQTGSYNHKSGNQVMQTDEYGARVS